MRWPSPLILVLLLVALPVHADTTREAQLCGGAGGPEQAIAACERLLATSPSDFRYRADIYNSRGVARAMLGDLNGAINDFNLAIRNWPNHWEAYSNRGLTYAKAGQFKQARGDFEMALSINPNNQKARGLLNELAQIEPPGGGRYGSTPVGAWEVRHGNLGFIYVFEGDGTYVHQRYSVVGGAAQVLSVDRGTYSVQGDRLILNPNEAPQTAFRWRIGTDPASPSNQPVLYLTYPDGQEEFFYPQ